MEADCSRMASLDGYSCQPFKLCLQQCTPHAEETYDISINFKVSISKQILKIISKFWFRKGFHNLRIEVIIVVVVIMIIIIIVVII
jgi:hypothetical protein